MFKMILLCMVATAGLLSGCEGSFFKKKMDEYSGKKTEAPPPIAPVPALPAVPPVVPPPPTQVIPPAPPVTPVAPVGPAETSLDDKINEINLYLACINRTVPRTNDSYNRYLSWVSEQTGPTCQERYISYSLYTLYEDGVKKCQDAAQKGATGGPSYPNMEKSVADMAAAYAQLVPLIQTVHDYYDQQDYKDDNCAKGKTLHPQLMDAFKRFREASQNLQKEIAAVKEELDAAELARLEAAVGKKLEWHTRKFGMDARKLMDTLPEGKPADLKPEAYLTGYSKLDESYNAWSAYLTANPTEGEGVFWFSAYQSSAKEFYTKAKFLKRDLAEGKKAAGNALQELVNEYNRLVGDFNNLRFQGL